MTVTTYTTYDVIPKAPEMHLQHEHYWRRTDASLRYIMQDASEAAENAAQMGDAHAECKYLDQINDASTVLGWRRRKGVRVVW